MPAKIPADPTLYERRQALMRLRRQIRALADPLTEHFGAEDPNLQAVAAAADGLSGLIAKLPTRAADTGAAPRSWDQHQAALRQKVKMLYDLQRLRIQAGGRSQPKAAGGEVQLHPLDLAVLEARAAELESLEAQMKKDITAHLKQVPFYRDVLADADRFKGLGPTIAAVILSSFDIERETTPSKMWRFAGLAVTPCQRCRHCQSPVTKAGKHPRNQCSRYQGGDEIKPGDTYDSGRPERPTAGEKLPYSVFVKTKMLGVLGPNLLKANSPWRKFYDNYKNRWASAGKGQSDGHRHNAATRYMVKMLLLEIWKEWRRYEGLPVRPSYAAEYLGKAHQG